MRHKHQLTTQSIKTAPIHISTIQTVPVPRFISTTYLRHVSLLRLSIDQPDPTPPTPTNQSPHTMFNFFRWFYDWLLGLFWYCCLNLRLSIRSTCKHTVDDMLI